MIEMFAVFAQMLIAMFDIPIWFQILDLLVTYQYFMLAGIGIGGYLLFVKFSTNPLLPRNPTELVLILSPGKTKFYKLNTRQLPFFYTKARGAWWYADPLRVSIRAPLPRTKKVKKISIKTKKKDKSAPKLPPQPDAPKFKKGATPDEIKAANEAYEKAIEEWNVNKEAILLEHAKQLKAAEEANTLASKVEEDKNTDVTKPKDRPTGSMLHVYVDAVNQPIYSLVRNTSKVMDLVVHRGVRPEITGHKLLLPPRLAFGNNWRLVINPKENTCYWQKTREKQPYKLNFFVRIGVYIIREVKVEVGAASTNSNAETQEVLEAVTVQKVVDSVGGVIKNVNFSSAAAYNLMKQIRFFERMWVPTLLGAMDMRIIVIILIMVAGIAVYLMMPKADVSQLGPPPDSIKKSGYGQQSSGGLIPAPAHLVVPYIRATS